MAKFASITQKERAASQAATVMKSVQGNEIKSVGTVRNYEQALTRVAEHSLANNQSLKEMTSERAINYLEQRSEMVGQSTLNMERQAIQCMMQHVTNKLEQNERLPVVQSERQQALESRAYTKTQVDLISQAQSERNAISTEIAHAAGLRAHELYTILPTAEQTPSERPASDAKFSGRDGVSYTVDGKGGLIREVNIPRALSERLENTRLSEARTITDRGVNYTQHYNINGGNRWSASFSYNSNQQLGWSAGGHGVRHSYAQERMIELTKSGLTRSEALEVVSQEMGHFRPEITEVYLR
ncbi:MAG: site-specific integrase [Colwellia sp.]|jgi:hypothetical protein